MTNHSKLILLVELDRPKSRRKSLSALRISERKRCKRLTRMHSNIVDVERGWTHRMTVGGGVDGLWAASGVMMEGQRDDRVR